MFNFVKNKSLFKTLGLSIVLSSIAMATAPSAPTSIGLTKSVLNPTTGVRLSFLDTSDNEDHYEITIRDYNTNVIHQKKTFPTVEGSNSYGYTSINYLQCNNIYKATLRAINATGEYSDTEKVFNINSTLGVPCDELFSVDIGEDTTISLSDGTINHGVKFAEINFSPILKNIPQPYKDGHINPYMRGYWSVLSAPENYNGSFVPPYDFLSSFVTSTPGVYTLQLNSFLHDDNSIKSVDTITVTVVE